jgi:hypothetical protein
MPDLGQSCTTERSGPDAQPSDALVLFGAMGDLAHRKIFPALYPMVERGRLDNPLIGVAKASRTNEHLKERVGDSVQQHVKHVDRRALAKLLGLLRYVGGDYQEPATFDHLRQALGAAASPAHYLASPPTLFTSVVESLTRARCMQNARVIVEKPFGRNLDSARRLNAALHPALLESRIFRIDHYLGKEAVLNLLFFRFARGDFYHYFRCQLLFHSFGEDMLKANYAHSHLSLRPGQIVRPPRLLSTADRCVRRPGSPSALLVLGPASISPLAGPRSQIRTGRCPPPVQHPHPGFGDRRQSKRGRRWHQ